MSVEFCGLRLAHPVINGSGTFDALAAARALGPGVEEDFPFAAYVSKTITLEPRAGNPPPRLWEAAAGMINSIGLPNRGVDSYLGQDLPRMRFTVTGAEGPVPVPVITNVMGSDAAQIARLFERCDGEPAIAALELNVSCPNVATGLDIGADPAELESVLRAVRPLTAKPLIVKLTPNTADVAACAAAAEAGGADAVSLVNTIRAMAVRAGPVRPVAGRTQRRAFGPRDPPHRARPGLGRLLACQDPGRGHGRRAERPACARTNGSRRRACGSRDREFPRSGRGAAHRAWAGQPAHLISLSQPSGCDSGNPGKNASPDARAKLQQPAFSSPSG